jgi:Fur family ferric uptake transcriptional regulator
MSTINKHEPASKEELRRRFNQIGLRFTEQREAVWRLFESDPAGFTIPRSVEKLAPRGIGQATVYRTVKALVDLGYLKWVHDRGGEHRFVASKPGHSHLVVCRSCSRVIESSDCDLSVLEKLIATQTGFTVEGHYLEFFGLCPECS